MNYYKIRFYIGCTFFMLWAIIEYVFSMTVRGLLGIDISNAMYIIDIHSVGFISLAAFLIYFYFFKKLEKAHKPFSIKTELEILFVCALIFILPIITLGRVSTIITEEKILKYDIYGNVAKEYYLTDIDEVQCQLYNTREGAQFQMNVIIEDENIQILGNNNQNPWNVMLMIDEIAKDNNIPKKIYMNVWIDEIESYSPIDQFFNSINGTYKHIADVEKLCTEESADDSIEQSGTIRGRFSD